MTTTKTTTIEASARPEEIQAAQVGDMTHEELLSRILLRAQYGMELDQLPRELAARWMDAARAQIAVNAAMLAAGLVPTFATLERTGLADAAPEQK